MSETKTSAAQLRAVSKYRQNKVKRLTVDFHESHSHLWEYLQSKPNKQGYIRSLIEKDMEESK